MLIQLCIFNRLRGARKNNYPTGNYFLINGMANHMYMHCMTIYAVSLSTIILNGRDCHENVWLPKMCPLNNSLNETIT